MFRVTAVSGFYQVQGINQLRRWNKQIIKRSTHVHQVRERRSRQTEEYTLLTVKETNSGMHLLMFFLLHQIVLVYGKSMNYSVINITRAASLDSFDLQEPHAWPACSNQKQCNRFHANLSSTSFKINRCVCSCSRDKAATFGKIKNGSWQCIGNKEIRDKELDGKLGFLGEFRQTRRQRRLKTWIYTLLQSRESLDVHFRLFVYIWVRTIL